MSKPDFPIRDLTEEEIRVYESDGLVCLYDVIPRIAPSSLDLEGPDQFAGPELPPQQQLDELVGKQRETE